jgi:hypothetical protein
MKADLSGGGRPQTASYRAAAQAQHLHHFPLSWLLHNNTRPRRSSQPYGGDPTQIGSPPAQPGSASTTEGAKGAGLGGADAWEAAGAAGRRGPGKQLVQGELRPTPAVAPTARLLMSLCNAPSDKAQSPFKMSDLEEVFWVGVVCTKA